jgi:hypothetical protein
MIFLKWITSLFKNNIDNHKECIIIEEKDLNPRCKYHEDPRDCSKECLKKQRRKNGRKVWD